MIKDERLLKEMQEQTQKGDQLWCEDICDALRESLAVSNYSAAMAVFIDAVATLLASVDIQQRDLWFTRICLAIHKAMMSRAKEIDKLLADNSHEQLIDLMRIITSES